MLVYLYPNSVTPHCIDSISISRQACDCIDCVLAKMMDCDILVVVLLTGTAAALSSFATVISKQTGSQRRENAVAYEAASRPCPCRERAYCNRIETTDRKEIFIFSVNNRNWRKYDWTKITSVVEYNYHDDKLLCHAHSKGVLVLSNANIRVHELTNHTAQHIWIQQQVSLVKNNFLDGINVDFESPISANRKDLQSGLTNYIRNLKAEFNQHLPGALVTMDIAWSCCGVDGRFYEYKDLAYALDFMFVMAYDERSQILYDCVAWANSAYNNTLYGIKSYLDIGIPPAKMVLGLPWYGYHYPCRTYDPTNKRCWLEHVPFRGVNCSDAAGTEVNYDVIVKVYLPRSSTGRCWDKTAQSPFFSLHGPVGDQVIQIWYDDPESLRMKYRMVSDLGLRGLGMWTADSLDYDDPEMIRSMWGAIPRLN